MSEVRYVLHPGFIRSAVDGDEHWVGIGALRELYLIPPHARVVAGPQLHGYHEAPGDIHCSPRFMSEDYPMFGGRR